MATEPAGSRARCLAAVTAGYVGMALVGFIVVDQLTRRAGRSDLSAVDAEGVISVLAMVAIASMGVLVIWRTQHVVGWWLLGIAVAVATTGVADAYALYGEIVSPGSLPGSAMIAPLAEAAFWPAFACLAMILLLTPTGEPPTPRWRHLVPLVLIAPAAWVLITLFSEDPFDPPLEQLQNPLAIEAMQPVLTAAEPFAAVVTHVVVVAAGVSLVRRFRRSTGVERQQLRWVAFAAIVAAVAVVAAFVAASADLEALLGVAALVVITAIPIGVTIAVSRYRLYELDRLISRSVLYTLLTALVAAVFAVAVLALGALLGRGQLTFGIAAVAAALAVAPLRQRAQRAVDRTMFGRRSEPFAVVSGVNQRLQASASPDAALRTLVETVADELRLPYVAVESAGGSSLAEVGTISPDGCERFPLTYQHEDVGTLVLGRRRGEDAFEPDERHLLVDLARSAGAVVRSAAVLGDLRTAQSRLVSAREDERRRLRRDLHDGLGPQLSAVTLKVDAARNHLRTDPALADAVLGELRADVKAAIDDIRRLVYALRPPGLDDLGLLGALQRHAQACTTPTADLRITVSGDQLQGLPAPVEVAAYRIATEAITNTVLHAHARRCDVNVRLDGDLVVEIDDDGTGLPEPWQAGVGVTSMRERAVELGGTCTFETDRATGTTVRARLPVNDRS